MTLSLADRAQAVRRVLWLVLALNIAVTLVKLAVGLMSGSLSVIADAFHSVVDSSSNIVALLGVWVSQRPADSNHPYGHQKYETIAALAIGGMLLIAAFEIARGAVGRLVGEANPPNVTPVVIGLLLFTFAANVAITVYEARAGRRLGSAVLLADAAHTRADLAVTLSVIASLLGTRLGLAWLDAAVAVIVALLLFRAAFGILRSTSEVLTDVAVADPQAVADIARAVPGVAAVGPVRSRGRPDAAYLDMHIMVNPAMDADQAHGVASEVEHRISAALPGVVDTVVHIEPEWVNGAENTWEDLALKLRGLADGLGLGIHDLHAHFERAGGFSVELHLEMRADLSLSEAHAVADHFESRARELLPDLRSLVTHLEPLSTTLQGEAGRLTPQRRAALEARLCRLADSLAGAGTCHDVHLHDVNGHINATLHVTQRGDVPLTDAHLLAESIERAIRSRERGLARIDIHVEPPEEN